jgi:predicted glycosyltransferase involved in capsule biosynthesis
MNTFDIGITTFSLRYDFVDNLVRNIRNLGIENNIFLCINGENNSNFSEEYRKKILKLCSDYNNVFPIFFVEMRGLSKMWNTLLIHSTKENLLILNDDISISTNNIFEVIYNHITTPEYFGLSIINNTFSFFVVNKKFIDELGYFDERLLGFGEEDGDIMCRLNKKMGMKIYRLNVSGLENIVSNIRHEHVKSGVGKYSFFNRDFIFNKKYKCNGNIYYFPEEIECDQLLEDSQLYPYEKFFLENKKNL